MKYIRSILVYLWIGLIIIVGLPYRAYCNHVKKTDAALGYQKLHKLVRPFCKVILALGGIKLDVCGKENIPSAGNVLYVGNHQSMLDIAVMLAVSEEPLGFLAKDNLEKNWLIKTWVASVGSVFIARGETRKALEAIIKSAKIAKSGHHLMVYPEGTRTKDGTLGEIKAGSLKIAQKGEAAIVPVVVDGDFQAMSPKTIWITPTTVKLTFLEVIPVETVKQTDTKELAKKIKTDIGRCL